jgi:hypothetical protein
MTKETGMSAVSKRLSKGRGRGRAAIFGAGAVALLLGLLISSASGQTVQAGNLIITIDGGVSPKKLPKKTPAPITLDVSGSVKTNDGTHLAALKTLALEFDKNGLINTKGLATCTVGKLQSTLTAQAKKSCGDALVGTGKVSAEIALPEQAPFDASGPLLIFNGVPKGGKPVLIFHVYAHVPAPTTFVTSGVISKASGKYGTSTLIQIPTIVGGQGSLTSFSAKINKTYDYKGKKESLLLATCPSGTLYAHGDFTFADGTKASGDIVRPCTPAG